MAKKRKSAKPSVPEAQKSVPLDETKVDTEMKEAEVDAADIEPVEQAPQDPTTIEEEITLSPDTIAEIGEPDKELVFQNIAKAYEEAKRKREKYKKIINPIIADYYYSLGKMQYKTGQITAGLWSIIKSVVYNPVVFRNR